MDANYQYLKSTMQGLANMVYNASQGYSVSKDDMLNSLKRTVKDYNKLVVPEDKIEVMDFREGGNY